MSAPEILRYYEQYDEHSRLASGVGAVEFARTLELLVRHLPPPCRVLDIGGGTGVYAQALARQGYEVHLLDLVPKHVEAARNRPGLASATLDDARRLPWPDGFARAVLLLGPRYHLTESADRDRALREGLRVLEPGGILAAAAISRFAPLADGLRRGRSSTTSCFNRYCSRTSNAGSIATRRPTSSASRRRTYTCPPNSRARSSTPASRTPPCMVSKDSPGQRPISSTAGPTPRAVSS